MNTKLPLKKIDYAIYHDPSLIPILFKDTSISKGLLYSRLRRAVPHSVGIEFEGAGEFIRPWYNDHKHLFSKDEVTDDDVARYFGVMSIQCDNPLSQNSYTYECVEPTALLWYDDTPSVPLEEVRVRIKDFTQLYGLRRVLDEMKNYVEIPIGGGIHIHIDLTNYINLDASYRRKVIKQYLNKHLSEVERIFPKYDGKFNKREVGDNRKKTYVNISMKNTLEFRIAPLTHNYEELIQWIVGCCKLTSEVIRQCHLGSIKLNHLPDGPIESVSPAVQEFMNILSGNSLNGYIQAVNGDRYTTYYAATGTTYGREYELV